MTYQVLIFFFKNVDFFFFYFNFIKNKAHYIFLQIGEKKYAL